MRFESWEQYGTFCIERDTEEYLAQWNDENEQELKEKYAEEEAEDRFLFSN